MTVTETPPAVPRKRGRVAPFVAAAVAVVLVLFVVLLATRDPATTRIGKSKLVGNPAPAIVGKTSSGEDFSLERLQGQWVLVNFFATWCTPCQAEHPELVKFAEEHRAAADAQVVSIAFNDDNAKVVSFFAANGGNWPVVVENTDAVAIRYGITGVPESYLIAPDGLVAAKITGGVRAADLDSYIAQLEGK
jgi:cytochrome c biogenesis protein CcmG/thiol:disulfide interchange protein DsbE